jgi:hypothetical protein
MMSRRLDGHMDSSGECADIRVQLGSYVFGAITPPDRATVVRHLATCPDCRDELAGLAGLPGLLLRPPAIAAAFSSDRGGVWHEVTVSGAAPPASSPPASHSEGGGGY